MVQRRIARRKFRYTVAMTSTAHAHHDHAHPEHAAPKGPLAIPVTAVLDTGTRKIAYRVGEGGALELVELKVGPRAEGLDDQSRRTSYYPVLAGLKEGDRVVARGGFLLDSQRQIEGKASLLYPQGQSAANLHAGHGGGPAAQPEHKH